MKVDLLEFKKLKAQEIELQRGINLLAGSNGSGKSSMLEQIFKKEIGNKLKIAYSSGVNESFSSIYAPIAETIRKKAQRSYYQYESESANSSDRDGKEKDTCFYFDRDWAAFLILAAAFTRPNRMLTFWLKEFKLKISRLVLQQHFPTNYRKKLKHSMEQIENGTLDYGFESSRIHKFLCSLSVHDSVGLSQKEVTIIPDLGNSPTFHPDNSLAAELSDFFREKNTFSNIKVLESEIQSAVDFFNLLQVASLGPKPIIPLKNVRLDFQERGGQSLPLNDLSDGEFQLLTTAALFDLFDDEKTIFLMDEIDAHIHPKMIKLIWRNLQNCKGHIINTSHNMMSLSLTEIGRILFMEDGYVQSEYKQKKSVLDILYGAYFSGAVARSLFYSCKSVFILDGLADWDIFKALCIKMGKSFREIEADAVFIQQSSGSDKIHGEQELFKPKVDWIETFVDSVKTLDLNTNEIRLRNFIIICDRDEVTAGRERDLHYLCENNKSKHNYRYSIHKFIWNRRYIESYLISKSAREELATEVDLETIKKNWKVPVERLQKDPDRYRTKYLGHVRNFGDFFTDTENFPGEAVKAVCCKPIINSFITDTSGLNSTKLNVYVNKMKESDIDPYLLKVFAKIETILATKE